MATSRLTKAQSLIQASKLVKRFRVPRLKIFSRAEIEDEISCVTGEIRRDFSGLVVVRSSASDEDGENLARAGEYDSFLSVDSQNPEDLEKALNGVLASYDEKSLNGRSEEVLVQEMVKELCMSGVAFTHDLNTGAPYYVINYDDTSGTTDSVTSGNEWSNRTLYIYRNATQDLKSERFNCLVMAIQELEEALENRFLDIEFALDHSFTPFLLQVRPISTSANWNRSLSNKIDSALRDAGSFVQEKFMRQAGLVGKTTVFGQMPDWNPAEMIGRAPKALAMSLYRQLITKDAWRKAREEMGYWTPRGHELMVSIAGQPFIDTRLSFSSFLPNGLSYSTGNKIVDTWNDTLKDNPGLHDKIEFEIAITILCLEAEKNAKNSLLKVLTEEELSEFISSLRVLTTKILSGQGAGSISNALRKLKVLSEIQSQQEKTHSLETLVADCIEYGTIPFAVLARHGFIANTFLNSLVSQGLLSELELEEFNSSLNTIATEFVKDMELASSGHSDTNTFMNKYGHLRPGTYDILSPRYDSIEGLIKKKDSSKKTQRDCVQFKLESCKMEAITNALKPYNIDGFDASRFFKYCREAIEGREYGKFIFTRSVSSLLERLADIGERHNLSREEIAHIPLEKFLEMEYSSFHRENCEQELRALSEANRELHHVTVSIRLPQVLHDPEGINVIPFQVSHPNFVTSSKVVAESIIVTSQDIDTDISGKIVLIEGADPGYDWIFSANISGLITKFGGVNSHMAIRCAEFSLPAAIGCGEQRFDLLSRSVRIQLDCASGLVTPLFD
jgi:phosphohistidine swiveling domain-containing protein